MSDAIKPIVLTMGDPAGVGPSMTWQAWDKLRDLGRVFYIRADADILRRSKPESVVGGIERISSPEDARDCYPNRLPVLHSECHASISPGLPDKASAPAIIKSIEDSVKDVFDGNACGIVTNPINKALLYDAGFSFPGHTEFLAELARRHTDAKDAPHPVMLLTGGGLRVALATIHMPLAEVPGAITPSLLQDIAHIVHVGLQQNYGVQSPRIAFAGLNPHAGEEGALGREEINVINPAAARLRREGLSVSDAQSGDTVFAAMLDGTYDAVIAMYHDQGLAPLKTLDMWQGVNTTLGLPFIRTSPDHGTGYEVARLGNPRADSLIAAIKAADDMAKNRAKNA